MCDNTPDELSREIAGGPTAVMNTLRRCREVHQEILSDIANARHVVIVGTGASLAMATCVRPIWDGHNLRSGREQTLEVVESGEILFATDIPSRYSDALVIAVSKSGESPETVAAVHRLGEGGARSVAVTAKSDSSLAMASRWTIETPIGTETGAASKSELSALAALLALSGALTIGSEHVAEVGHLLSLVVEDYEQTIASGSTLARSRRIWAVGFGTGFGVAQALGLLFHEKAGIPVVVGTPSGFRHGLVEAANGDDALVIIDCGDLSSESSKYLRLLNSDAERVGMNVVHIGQELVMSTMIRLTANHTASRALEAVLRAQQLAHSTAIAAGTYVDGFRVLRHMVKPSTPW